MLTDMPPSDHTSEDIHEHSNIDEVSLETDVGDIVHPDLIALRYTASLECLSVEANRVAAFSTSCFHFES